MGALFFLIVVTMMPFALGPDLALLARIGPAILWLGALLASLLALDRLFATDHDDGSLDLLMMGRMPLELAVAAKAIAHWLTTAVPLVVITPVVAFYMTYDWHGMVDTVDRWIPLHQRAIVRGLAREIDRAIAGFLRGQSMVCLILGTFYAVMLTASGLNFGLLIGLLSGLLTFIPYVGSMTGLVLGLGVAVAQFWPQYTPILIVLSIFFVGQFIEGNVLAPRLVGKSVGLHPVWLIFALLAFGYLFGFVGLLVAVPLAATIGVLARFAMRRYLSSTFYTGETSG